MENFSFSVNDTIKMKFSVGGGASPQPVPPEPGSSGAVIAGMPTVLLHGVIAQHGETISGIIEEGE